MTIRRQPSDFIVEEKLDQAFLAQLDAEPSAAAKHAIYQLTKTSLATPEAIQALGKALGVRHALIGFGGLKDKHARTTQAVSIPTTGPGHASVLPNDVGGAQWSATRIGWSRREMNADAIEGNRFTIIVRDLSPGASNELDRRARLLADPDAQAGTLLVVNYFGDQRFGSARHGQGWVARRLIEGDFEGALRLAVGTPSRKDSGKTREFRRIAAQHWGDWQGLARRLPRSSERAPFERLASRGPAAPAPDQAAFRQAFADLPYFIQMMSVEAYQSYLWNQTVYEFLLHQSTGADQARAELPAGKGSAALGDSLLRTPDDFGEMLFPQAASVDDRMRWLDVPLLAAKTQLEEPWGPCARRVLEREGLTVASLKIPGLRRPFFGEASRRLFVEAGAFDLSSPQPDELTRGGSRLQRTLRFDLPRGSYATVLLRALGQ